MDRANLKSWFGKTVNLTLSLPDEDGEEDFLEERVKILGADSRLLYYEDEDGQSQFVNWDYVVGGSLYDPKIDDEKPPKKGAAKDAEDGVIRKPLARKLLF